jgi:ParB-like chromosome segregation protein Spo0J
MRVDLRTLRPDPIRDQLIDPIDEGRAEALVASINEHGFWGGIAIRKADDGGTPYIVAGNHRVYCALKAGVTHHDVPVQNYNDEEAIRAYATENVTQRGDQGLAMAGAVGSAIRHILKVVLTNNRRFSWIHDNRVNLEEIRGNIMSQKGLGVPCIMKFFKGISGVTENVVRDQLANLKASGDYARIIKEVSQEIEEEQAAERAEREQLEAEAAAKKEAAEKAAAKAEEAKAKAEKDAADKAAKQEAAEAKKAAKAAQQEQAKAEADLEKSQPVKDTIVAIEKAVKSSSKKAPTFDLKGVGRYLKKQQVINVFRKIVERESIRKHIPVSVQADLAAQLLDEANRHNDGVVTGVFIQSYLPQIIQGTKKWSDLKLSEEALREIEQEARQHEWITLAHHFCRNIAGSNKDAHQMISMKDQYPNLQFSITPELRNTVRFAHLQIQKLATKLNVL